MGQGNAFIAVADDATAASWNPAGIAQLEKPEGSFALEWFSSRNYIESTPHPESEGGGDVEERDLNYASIVYPLALERHLVLSLNYLRLYRLDQQREFAVDYGDQFGAGTQMYSRYSWKGEGSLAVVAPAVAANVTDKLSLGLAVNIWNDDITQSSSFRKRNYSWSSIDILFLGLHNEDIAWTKEEYWVKRGYSLTLGGIYRLSKEWAVGGVLKPPFTLNLDYKVTTSGENGGMAYGPDHVRGESDLKMPLSAGLGLAWRPSDPLTLSTDVVWTDWSSYRYRVAGQDVSPLTNWPYRENQCDDTYTWRSGAEYLVIRDRYVVPLRCGFAVDPSPSVDQVDDFYTVSLGTGLQYDRYAFDIAYEVRWANGVNDAQVNDTGGHENVLQHRVLASLIVYFR